MARIPDPDTLQMLEDMRATMDAIAEGEIIGMGQYESLRRALLLKPELAPHLPTWLRGRRTEDDFRRMINTTPANSLEFIREELEPAYDYLEDLLFNPPKQPDVHPLFRTVELPRITRKTPVPAEASKSGVPKPQRVPKPHTRVFVVHGHDPGRLAMVLRFVEKLKFEAINLAERPSLSLTIMEKFEANSEVDYAIVLMTPDDAGRAAAEGVTLQHRARQNVVLELGFFIGKLGRSHVIALIVGRLEKPSDIDGVIYVAWDDGGAWQHTIAKNMKAVGLPVDLNRLA